MRLFDRARRNNQLSKDGSDDPSFTGADGRVCGTG